MKFYFCEKCGKRITEKDIEEGRGHDKKLKGMYCQSCAAGVRTMETLPITDKEAREILNKKRSGSSNAKTAVRIKPASRIVKRYESKVLSVKNGEGARSSKPSHSSRRAVARKATSERMRRVAPAGFPQAKSGLSPAALGAVALGGVLLLGGAVLVLGNGRSSAPEKRSAKRSTKRDRSSDARPAVDASVRPASRRSAGPPSQRERLDAAAFPKTEAARRGQPLSTSRAPVPSVLATPAPVRKIRDAPLPAAPVAAPSREAGGARGTGETGAPQVKKGPPVASKKSGGANNLADAAASAELEALGRRDIPRAKPNEEEEAAENPFKNKAANPEKTRGRNPFEPKPPASKKKEEVAKPKTIPVSKPKAKRQPVYVRGKQVDLFPPGRASRLADYVSPAAPNKNFGIKESRYDGWTWESRDRSGFNVKQGVLTFAKQGSLTIDGFQPKEFNLSFELRLNNAGSAFTLQFGAAKEGINLLTVQAGGLAPGVWDQTKTKNNIQILTKQAKRYRIKPGSWVPLNVAVRRNQVQVFANNKSVASFSPPHPTQYGRFGFLLLGRKGAKNTGFKIRKCRLFAP